MKIVNISDIHGQLGDDIPDGDVLIIAGDICPADDHKIPYQAYWLENEFNPWLDYLPFDNDHIVVIAGNHDFVFQKAPHLVPKLNCHYLQDSSVVINGIKFYGYPHSPKFGQWAFMHNKIDLASLCADIPDDINVLVSHSPAYGILDRVTDKACWAYKDPNWDGDAGYCGCKKLKEKINSLDNLKLHVCGHIHSGHGIQKPFHDGDPIFVNASYVNENYDHDYDIIVVDI